ncbi:hypothetical protein CS369_16400 [Candidatus Symbiopectobacterium sp. 'North America']|nr:hypothetical protein [Candidatus Symbiopectobacterium sp. 'North America']
MSVVYVVVLTYVRPLEAIDEQIPAHVEWLKQGYADGVFLASGRRIPRTGGVILAKSDSLEQLQVRLNQDPFQKLGLAHADIIPFDASMTAPALQGLQLSLHVNTASSSMLIELVVPSAFLYLFYTPACDINDIFTP